MNPDSVSAQVPDFADGVRRLQMKPARNTSLDTSFVSERRMSQYEGIMKRCSEVHESAKCGYEDIPRPSPYTFKKFPTGSSYEGAFDITGMTGYGEYTFPNGVVYRGDFQDGMFHGQGELIYNEGPEADSVISGTWVNGILTERKIHFNGRLEYDENDWKYCKLPDRRYEVEFEEDLVSAGKTRVTAEDPPRVIPHGCYDTGDGFYYPDTKVVSDYKNDQDVTRGPSAQERRWIVDNCRKKPVGVVGARPDLYETWQSPALERAPQPEPSVSFRPKFRNPSIATDQLSMAEQHVYGTLFYDPSRMLPVEDFNK